MTETNVVPIDYEKMLANLCRFSFNCAPDQKMPVAAEQVVALWKMREGVKMLLACAEAPVPETPEQAEKASADMEAIEAHLRTWLGAFEDALRREQNPRPKVWTPA